MHTKLLNTPQLRVGIVLKDDGHRQRLTARLIWMKAET